MCGWWMDVPGINMTGDHTHVAFSGLLGHVRYVPTVAASNVCVHRVRAYKHRCVGFVCICVYVRVAMHGKL